MNRFDMVEDIMEFKIKSWTVEEALQCMPPDTTLGAAKGRLWDMYTTAHESLTLDALIKQHKAIFNRPENDYPETGGSL